MLVGAFEADDERQFVPCLRRGHDVSGHVFLLTLGVLFLADQLRQAHHARLYARVAVGALVGLWVFSLWITSVYFHSPAEKISGFCAVMYLSFGGVLVVSHISRVYPRVVPWVVP
jgi:hypothetical protein